MSSMRPSTYSGTPVIIDFGGVPIRSGQYRRTTARLPPIPPLVMMTAWARSSKSPTASRLDGAAARGVVGGKKCAAHAHDCAAVEDQFIDAMAVVEGDQSASGGRKEGGVGEGFDDAGAGSPGDAVEARGTELP